MGIKVFGLVDTNADPKKVDFVIPGNDDSSKSIGFVVNYLKNCILQGLEERQDEKEAQAMSEKKQEEIKKSTDEKEDSPSVDSSDTKEEKSELKVENTSEEN